MFRKSAFVSCCLLLFALIHVNHVHCGTFEEETSMTGKQKEILDEFKKNMIPKIPEKSYLKNYVNDDLFFIRWLRASNFDRQAAETMFLDHLKWRENERIDDMDKEEWTDMQRLMPMFTDNYDNAGRPVAEILMGDWATRTAVLTGKQQRAVRWISRLYELESRRLYKQRAAGKEVAQGVFLVALDGFSILEQACPSCLAIYLSVATMYENHYPGMVDAIYFLNMPPAFDLVLRTVKPVLRESTRNVLISYISEQQWKPIIDPMIKKENRGTKVGGTIQREVE